MELASRHRGLLQTLGLVHHFVAGYMLTCTLLETFFLVNDLKVLELTCPPQKSIRRRVLDDLNELHASNQWENSRRIQLESGTTTAAPARVDLTPTKQAAQGDNFHRHFWTYGDFYG